MVVPTVIAGKTGCVTAGSDTGKNVESDPPYRDAAHARQRSRHNTCLIYTARG